MAAVLRDSRRAMDCESFDDVAKLINRLSGRLELCASSYSTILI
jgi:hypothetical protein